MPFKDGGIVAGALRIAMLARREPERELEVERQPIRRRSGDLLDPAAQIGADIFDFAFPDALDGRREIVFEFSRDTIQRLVGEIERSSPAYRR